MSIIESLNWRYAAKRLNGVKVSDVHVAKIIEAARLAPTSSGLQPFEMFVITNQDLKNEVRKLAFNQSQVSDCSHLLVFAAWSTYSLDRIDHYFDHYEAERNGEKGSSDAYKKGVVNHLTSLTEEAQFEHAARQIYIALGFAMAEAAVLKIDSSPMEGFLPSKLDDLLKLREKGLKSVLLLPIGYRDEENDWQVNLKKVRKSTDHMVHYIE